MQLIFKKLGTSPKNLMRVSGYLEIQNPQNREFSYARSLDPGRFYPRFHIYVEERPKQIILNLHLDAKKPSYQGVAAHSGEYDGAVVEKEAARIQLIAQKISTVEPSANQELGFKNKKPWWKRWFRQG